MVGLTNAFKAVTSTKATPKGNAGYDNPRENIDPHVKTQAFSTKEITLSDGSAAGFVMNDAAGVLSGGNAGGGGAMTSPFDFLMDDNVADVFVIREGLNHYMCIQSTNGSESVVFGCGATPDILTITTAKVEVGVDLDITGDIIVSGTVDGIDIAGMSALVTANSLKDTNVTTNLSAGTRAPTTIDVNSSDGTNATLVEADTTNAGILGSDKWDEIVANSSHRADNTQAHSDYLLNSGTDIAVGPLTITADNSTADQAYVPMVLYNTDATPPAASGFPVGTLYVQYTA